MYEGLKFSHVKFYHDLSAGFKNFARKPQNFGDNWPLASICCLILFKFSKSDNNTLFFTILHLNILYFKCGKLSVMLHALKVMGI